MGFLERVRKGISLFGLWTSILIALTPLRQAWAAAHHATPPRRGLALWPAAWRALRARPAEPAPLSTYTTLGAVRSHAASSRGVAIICANATLHVTVLAPDLLRLQVQRDGEDLDTFSYAIARADETWPATPFTVRTEPAALIVETEAIVLRVRTDGAEIALNDRRDGREITRIVWGPGWRDRALACSFGLATGERIYGLGEKAFGMDRRGHVYQMWNDDPSGAYVQGKDPLYLNIPFIISGRGPYAGGLFLDNTYRSTVDAGCSQTDRLTLRADGGPLRVYLFAGPTAGAVAERYTELTGRLRLPPLWALGYHQSRWSYTPDSRARDIAAEFRRRSIPCDAIHLDIHHMDGYRCFTWHSQRFPQPARLMHDLHGQGFKVVSLVDCGVKRDRADNVCRDGLAQRVFCTYPDGSLYRGPVWPGDCYFPDFTSPRVRAWWGRQHKGLMETGVDGVWNDMNEPTIFGPTSTTLLDCVRHDWEGRGADHAQAHNVYGLLMARASAEGLAALQPDRRPFVITRAGWAGLQRFAMNWMGDNTSTWEHLRLTIPMIANLGLCGLAFTGPDAGGFAGDCEPDLLARWLQLGVFTPFLRNHSALGTADQEPWAHGEPYESINRRTIALRYHLLPYIYTAFWQCSRSGVPMLRPLFMVWPDDAQAAAIDDQFMFGDALLVAPVMERGATRRTVYLPAGVWYDWWTGTRCDGGCTITVDAPLDRLPLFARAGSAVPGWPAMQFVGERPVDALTLHVFPGDGGSVLYEDDGATPAYQRGDYCVTEIAVQRTEHGIAVERRCSGPFTPVYTEVELAVHGLDATPAPLAHSGDGAALSGAYEAASRTWRWRAPLARTYVIEQRA